MEEEEYDFDNWHKDVPIDEAELKRKEKKKRKAEHKKIREEAKKKKEEKEKEEKEKEEEEKEETSDSEKKVKKDKKDKKEKKKDKKKDKKRKKDDDDEDNNSSDSKDENEGENENGKELKKRKKEETTTKKGEFGVWIGNLAFSTTEEMLRKFLQGCGKITRINLPINKQTKNNKGFAYVDFEDQESMENAIKLSEQTLENRNLLIKSSKDFRGRPAKQISAKSSSGIEYKEDGNNNYNNTNNGGKYNGYNKDNKESPTVFVGNLPYAATAEGIKRCFKDYGEISNVRIATFEDNQEKCKGFAYVDYTNVESARKAVYAGRKPKLLGRILRVEYAGEEATRRGYNKLHKKPNKEKSTKPAEPKPIAIAKWDGELVTFKGKRTVFDNDD